MKKNLRSKKGQAVVELAIILPILLMIIIGIFEIGRLMNYYLVISNCAREGARTAAIGGTNEEVTQIVENVASDLDKSKIVIEITPDLAGRTRGVPVTVKVSYIVDNVIPSVYNTINNQITLQTKVVMRVE